MWFVCFWYFFPRFSNLPYSGVYFAVKILWQSITLVANEYALSTFKFFWKPTRILDQFVFSEDGIYNEHIVFLIIFNFWVKNTILSKIFSNKLEFRQCVFIRYQGDRLSKYLNSEVHPRIWQIGKSWKKNTKNKRIT